MAILELPIRGKIQRFDLFRFSREVLGYDKLQIDPHLRWCSQAGKHHKRTLYLKPRGTYKSTIYTISDTIFRLLQNPDLRILIANATHDMARQFLSEIAGHYIRNERLIEVHNYLYGCDPLDENSATAEKLVLNSRRIIRKEPSVAVIGALQNIVSSHFDIIKVDDLCNLEDRESDLVREKKKRWYQDLIAILEPEGELQVVGTRWADQDVYDFIINTINPRMPEGSKYEIGIEPCWLDDGKTPRFPNILSKKRLDELMVEMGPLVFSCQEELQPLSSAHQLFKPAEIQTISHKEVDIFQCERYGGLDAAEGGEDFSSFVFVLKLQDGRLLVFHADMENEPQDKAIKKMVSFQKSFKLRKFWLEMNSLGIAKSAWEKGDRSNFEILLKQEQLTQKVTVPYVPIWHGSNKPTRISGLQPHYVNGTLLFWDTWAQDYPLLVNQLNRFPMGHDDGPDTLEMVVSGILNDEKPFKPCAPGGVTGPNIWRF